MKLPTLLAIFAALAASACASPNALSPQAELAAPAPELAGSGAFPSLIEVDPGLPAQVVYRPADPAAMGDVKLGLYVFGNGACSDDGASARPHLLEIASHGYIAIAPGYILSGDDAVERGAPSNPPTRFEQLREAIDWVLAENQRPESRYYGRIDPEAIAVSGFSCGGLQAMLVAPDPRVATLVMMNSGLFIGQPTAMAGMEANKDALGAVHSPTLYVLGGPEDIAYANGMDDFAQLNHVPAAVANIGVGHGGTYARANGGAAAQVVVRWLEWQLRGDSEARAFFVGEQCGLCQDPDWTYSAKRLE
jgi:hypothetical protein